MIPIDPNLDILRQLTRIADAANAPHASPWTDWLKTIASFVAGLLTAFLGDLIKNRSSERNEQLQMRRIVYYELSQCFFSLHLMVGQETTLREVRFQVFKDLCPFDGEAYIKQNPAVFYGLPEGQILMQMYYWFHRVDGGGLESPRTYGLVEMKAPLRFFSDRYRKSNVLKKNFKSLLSTNDYKALDSAVEAYKSMATMEEMVDSGLFTIIKRPGSFESPQP